MRGLRALGAGALVLAAGCASAGRSPNMVAMGPGAFGPTIAAPGGMQPQAENTAGLNAFQGVAPGSGIMPIASVTAAVGVEHPIGPVRPTLLRRPDPNSSRFGSRVALASWEAQQADPDAALPMLPVALVVAPRPYSALEDGAATLAAGPAAGSDETVSAPALPALRRRSSGGALTLALNAGDESGQGAPAASRAALPTVAEPPAAQDPVAQPAPATPPRSGLPSAAEAPAPSEAAPVRRRPARLPGALESAAQPAPVAPRTRNRAAILPGAVEAEATTTAESDSPPGPARLPAASEAAAVPAAEPSEGAPSPLQLPVRPLALRPGGRGLARQSTRGLAPVPGAVEAEPDAHASNSNRAFPLSAAELDDSATDDSGRTLPPPRLLSGRRRPAPANDSADQPATGGAPSQATAPPQPESSVSPFGDNPPPLRQPRWKRLLLFWRPDAS